jgi:hypothetical protein
MPFGSDLFSLPQEERARADGALGLLQATESRAMIYIACDVTSMSSLS